MTSLKRLVAAIAATTTLQLGVMRVVSAQNSNDSRCFDTRFDNLNATASYSVPGFAPPGNSSKSTWNFSTGVVTYDGNITQRLWINTSPSIQMDSDSLPYQGCILALYSLVGKPGEDNNGDCQSSLGQECVAALVKNSNEVAKSLSARADEDAQRYKKLNGSIISLSMAQCTDLASSLPNVCQTTGPIVYAAVRKWKEFSFADRYLNCKLMNCWPLLTRFNFVSFHRPPSCSLCQRDAREGKRFGRTPPLSEPGGKRYRSNLSHCGIYYSPSSFI